jgi:hypothetical protein
MNFYLHDSTMNLAKEIWNPLRSQAESFERFFALCCGPRLFIRNLHHNHHRSLDIVVEIFQLT